MVYWWGRRGDNDDDNNYKRRCRRRQRQWRQRWVRYLLIKFKLQWPLDYENFIGKQSMHNFNLITKQHCGRFHILMHWNCASLCLYHFDDQRFRYRVRDSLYFSQRLNTIQTVHMQINSHMWPSHRTLFLLLSSPSPSSSSWQTVHTD